MTRAQRRDAARRLRRAGLPAAAALAASGLAAGGLAPAAAQEMPAEQAPATSAPAPAEPTPSAPAPEASTPEAPAAPALGDAAPSGSKGPRAQKTTGSDVRRARADQGDRRDRNDGSRPGGAAPALTPPDTALAEPGPAPVGVPNFFIEKFRIPPFLLPIYQAAGTEYGIRWEILAAINEIETDYGRNLNVSSAGAMGWMQFMPATWKAYGVDANRDGKRDPYNPVDAIFAAARYLKASGAQDDLRKAIFAYNRADWYVESVLMRAKLIGGLPSDLIGSLSGLTEGLFPVHAQASYADAVNPAQAAERKRAGQNAAMPVDSDADRRQIRIYAKPGAAVTAVQDGTIIGIGRTQRLGRFIRLRDAYGNEYTYAHLHSVSSEIAVAKPSAREQAAERMRGGEFEGADPRPTGPASTTSRDGGAATGSGRSSDGGSATGVGREHDDLRPMGGALTALDTLILRTARTIGTAGASSVVLPGEPGASSTPDAPAADPAAAPEQGEQAPAAGKQPAVPPTSAPDPAAEPEQPEPEPSPTNQIPGIAPAPVAEQPATGTAMTPAPPVTTTAPMEPSEPLPLPTRPERLPDAPAPEETAPAEPDPASGLPEGATFGRYFTVDYGLKRDDVVLKPLRVGQRVIAGTILGRIGPNGARPTDAEGHVLFEIRPAGRGAPRIDPKPILDGWKLLESTALYRAKGANALVGKATSVGQILLMDKQQLQRRVLANSRIQIYPGGRRDIAAGAIDRRVLASLEFLAANGLKPTVTSLRRGHGVYTKSGNVSHHTTGTAVDIGAINGIRITPATQGKGSVTDIAVRRLLTLQGTMKPAQIITLHAYDGADNTLAMADHGDHIHIGWRPDGATPTGPVKNELSSALRPSQWQALVRRLSKIENPQLRNGPPTEGQRREKRRQGRPAA